MRMLHLVLRLDQAGSAAFIVVALIAAPVLALLAPWRVLVWVLGLGFIAYAVMLAVLGVCMAWGLTRRAARGEELPQQLWRSVLKMPDNDRGGEVTPPPRRRCAATAAAAGDDA